MPENNESDAALSDYLYDTTNNHLNQTSMSSSGDPQRLASILQQLFFKMSDNRTLYDIPPGFSEAGIVPSSSGTLSPSFLSVISYLPVSPSDAESYRLLSVISLWFVLIINPILVNILVSIDRADWWDTSRFSRSYSESSAICLPRTFWSNVILLNYLSHSTRSCWTYQIRWIS